MVEAIVEEGLGARFRWFLSTRDAHELYSRYGFSTPNERVMERPGPFLRVTHES
jgi:hypothetical protein